MKRPTIREILREYPPKFPLEREDECRPKMGGLSICSRGTFRCVTHHSEWWMNWELVTKNFLHTIYLGTYQKEQGRKGWIGLVVDSKESTQNFLISPKENIVLHSEANTFEEGMLLVEQVLSETRMREIMRDAD